MLFATDRISPLLTISVATSSGPFRSWSMRTLTLQQAIEQLDPDRVGMEITIVQCVAPAPGQRVRSLCERMGIGTVPWDSGVGRRLLFLGAESLCGWTVGRGEPGVVQDMEQKQVTNLQHRAYALDYSYGTEAYETLYQEFVIGTPLLLPFLLHMGVTMKEEFDPLYEQMTEEMQEPEFRGLWFFLSVWGTKPERS